MLKITTPKIKTLIENANLDYNAIENEALNAYLPKIFPTCPFTEGLCNEKQCHECNNFKNALK